MIEERDVSIDQALQRLLFSDLELEWRTRRYIAERLNDLPSPPDPERDRREAVMSINRIKDLLCKNGLKRGEAEQFIAEALGVPSAGTLRQTLQRTKKSQRAPGK